MKRIILFFVFCILLSSCAVNRTHIPKEFFVSGFDFTKYTDKGFLITPYEYNGVYKSIGIIQINIAPEANLIENGSGYTTKDGQKIMRLEWEIEKVSVMEAIDSMYTVAIKMGADAIVSLEVGNDVKMYEQGTKHPVAIVGNVINGYAIKRVASKVEK